MGVLQRIREFFKEVLREFRLVHWPSRGEVLNSTVIVVVMVFILAFFMGAVDVVLSKIVEVILK